MRVQAAENRTGVKMNYFPFSEVGEMEAALVGARCDAQSHDVSELANGRAAFHGRRNDFDILPDRLTIDPLAPVVRNGDAEFARAVDWTFYALVQAQIDGGDQGQRRSNEAKP